ncbi:thioredoxin H4-1-like [Phalaenopsis equestris]|uniref:thioredoxin H4-1-like n=1 Tax=Phalaenopsis equestris TaxID=78828 RepID=UPI0009E5F13C|nr:thioredoxin H4-1-like [Phalaenopsis equestris]
MGICLGRSRDKADDSNVCFTYGNAHIVRSLEDWDEKISEAKKEGKIVVVNFSAAWCGPCRVIIPFFAELSLQYPQLFFLSVDVDDLPDLCTSMDIHATPTFFFFRDGNQIDKLVGANKPELHKKILAFAESAHCSN